jgi:DNA-binding MarR family transcriptional regulator
MNRILGRYNASMREEMAALGLTTPKVRTLAVLAMIDGILIGELAVYAVVEHSTLSRTLDALEKESLVRRPRAPEDQRATRVFLTDAGRAPFEKVWPRMAQPYAQMFQDISTEERLGFEATLQKILRNVRIHDF